MSAPAMISLEEAAKRSGRNIGHLRRLCADRWQAAGLAEHRRGPDGRGKPAWFVREEADAAFARVKVPEQIGTDLRRYPERKRRQALHRLSILDRWAKAVKAGFDLGLEKTRVTNHFLERLLIDENLRVSPRTLYYWEKSYRANGLAGLVDGRGGDHTDAPTAADPFLEEVQRLYLTPQRPTLKSCHVMASFKAREQGWRIHNYKRCQRHVEKLPAAVVYKKRGGEEAYVNHAEPYLERDYTTLASNEVWNADHHQFDVMVRHQGRHVRPWLTAFQDLRSRKIVGWHVYPDAPNSDVIFTTFRAAVLDCYAPQNLLIDNGKDFDCYALNGRTKRDRWAKRRVRLTLDERAGLFAQLGIETTHAQPYHGQSKPIERWFGFVEQHTRFWPTYCGNSTAAKPEDLQLQLERGKAPTLEEFSAWFREWVTAYNAGHQHSGDGMDGRTPDRVWAENLTLRRTASPELLSLICLRREGPVVVGQNGVTWQGLRYGQHAPELHRLLGQQVMLAIDERDATRVIVLSLDGKFVCDAEANARVPANATAQDLRDAMGAKRRDRQLLRTFVERRPRLHEDLPDRLVRAQAAKAAAAAAEGPKPTPPPDGRIQPVRHPLEDQLPLLRAAMERRSTTRRVAAGGESIDVAAISFTDLADAARGRAGGDDGDDDDQDTLGQLGRALGGE